MLNKTNFVDHQTVITADFLNGLQDAVIDADASAQLARDYVEQAEGDMAAIKTELEGKIKSNADKIRANEVHLGAVDSSLTLLDHTAHQAFSEANGARVQAGYARKLAEDLTPRVDAVEGDLNALAIRVAEGATDITAEYITSKASRPTLTIEDFFMEQADGLYRIDTGDGEEPHIARVVTDRSGSVHMDVVGYIHGDRIQRIYIDSTLVTTVTMNSGDGAVEINPETLVGDLATAKAQTTENSGAISQLSESITEIKEATELLIEYGEPPMDIALNVISNEPVVRSGDNVTVTRNGNRIDVTTTFDGDKWVAFLMPTYGTKYFNFAITVDEPSKIAAVRRSIGVTDASPGYTDSTLNLEGKTYTRRSYASNASPCYLLFYLPRTTRSFSAEIHIIEDAEGTQPHIKDGLIPDFTQGNSNFFIGKYSGINTEEASSGNEGRWNCAVGTLAMNANTTGDHCTAVGFQAMMKNTTGDGNTGLGEDTLYENTTGTSNTAVGAHSGQNTTGSGNTFIGTSAGMINTSGFYNVFVGAEAGKASSAGQGVRTGARNIFIGHGVVATADVSDCIVIGSDSYADASGQMVLGSSRTNELIIRTGGVRRKINFNDDGTVTWESI